MRRKQVRNEWIKIKKEMTMEDKTNRFWRETLIKVLEVVIVGVLLILMYNGYISKERMIRVLIVLLIVLVYLLVGYIIKEIIYIYLERRFKGVRYEDIEDVKMLYSKKISEEAEGVRERKEPYKGLVIKIIRLLIVIQTIMNPTYAIMIYVIYERLYLLIGWVNLRFERHKKIRIMIYNIILIFFIHPVLRFWIMYYKVLERWRSKLFFELMFRRLEGLVMSLTLMSVVYSCIKILDLWMIIIIVYMILVSIEYWPREFLKERMAHLWMIPAIEDVIDARNKSTIIGNVINILCESFELDYSLKTQLVDSGYIKERDNRMYWYIIIKFCFNNLEDGIRVVKRKPCLNFFLNLFYIEKEEIVEYFYGILYFKGEDLERAKEYYKKYLSFVKNRIIMLWEMEEWMGLERSKININLYSMRLTILDDEEGEKIDEEKLTIGKFNVEGREADFMDIKEYYKRLCKEVYRFEERERMDKWIYAKLDKYNADLGTYCSEEDKIRFKEEMSKFLLEVEEEWRERKGNKKGLR